jgi:hypothetical protein
MTIRDFVRVQSQRAGGFSAALFLLLFMLNGNALMVAAPVVATIGVLVYYAVAIGLEWHYNRPAYSHYPAQTQQPEEGQETFVQPVADDAPTAAPLTVRMVAPPVRDKVQCNHAHLRLLIEAIREQEIDKSKISLRELHGIGISRFANSGKSDAEKLLDYLIDRQAVVKNGLQYSAVDQHFVWGKWSEL